MGILTIEHEQTMTDKSNIIQLDLDADTIVFKKNAIKWCDLHWADLMFALKDRGLEDYIAESEEELSKKLVAGEGDPCFDAFNNINIGAMALFGPMKIINDYGGCPVCAFHKVVDHSADIVTAKYKEPH